MSLLPKSIHWCRRYPTKFNSGRDIPLGGLDRRSVETASVNMLGYSLSTRWSYFERAEFWHRTRRLMGHRHVDSGAVSSGYQPLV